MSGKHWGTKVEDTESKPSKSSKSVHFGANVIVEGADRTAPSNESDHVEASEAMVSSLEEALIQSQQHTNTEEEDAPASGLLEEEETTGERGLVCESCDSGGDNLFACSACKKSYHSECLVTLVPLMLCEICSEYQEETKVEMATDTSDTGSGDDEDDNDDDSYNESSAGAADAEDRGEMMGQLLQGRRRVLKARRPGQESTLT